LRMVLTAPPAFIDMRLVDAVVFYLGLLQNQC